MPEQTLVILTPAFPEHAAEVLLPWQLSFIHNLKRNHPQVHVTVIAFRHPGGASRIFDWDGTPVFVAGHQGSGKLRSLMLWRRVWRRLNEVRSESRRTGLLSLFCNECAWIGERYARRHKLNHKIWILGQDARPSNKMVARIRPAAEDLIAISDFLVRSFAESHGVRPSHLIPIGIDPLTFPPSAPKDIDLIAVGSLSGIKRHDIFIRVVAEIAKHRPVRALICGGGTEHHALQELIRQLGLEGQIEMTGMRSHWEALELMQRSRILLHTSAYEGFGLVCTEALFACARAVSFTRPMDAAIPGWHYASDIADMVSITTQLLDDKDAGHPVLPFSMDDTCRQIIQLFGYEAPNQLRLPEAAVG